ncbi:MAG: hypothetical protein K0S53_2667 [Bacteroidetes bacterium]|jgi:hypothetical protein|nr:hypothetical protein [Bacteroidota bacterium]MDF2452323.1 hypothetical protein [Bacteroidota bacterium]
MKKTLLLVSLITITALALLSNLNTIDASASLPNNGTAGAPADGGGATCTGCHAGTATQTTGVISSDIPGSGYVGGTTYNFTVTMSGAAAYGFEMTPQTATSNVGLGTWIAGVGTGVSTKYIKQSAKKTGASATWTFKWTAPATATTVTFYGAFNYANNNNTTSGDIIKKSSVTYFANTTGIAEHKNAAIIVLFPNPTTEELHISSSGFLKEGKILSVDGKISKIISEYELISKTISVRDLQEGIYFLNITSEDGRTSSSKFIKN